MSESGTGALSSVPRGIHHVEIWVADLGDAEPAWSWLLQRVGFTREQSWSAGRSWAAGSAYVTLVEAPAINAPDHDRRRPGMNHLAVWGGSPQEVDALMAAAPEHGWVALYADRYPHAGGADHYAGWLENVQGFKVEVVADMTRPDVT